MKTSKILAIGLFLATPAYADDFSSPIEGQITTYVVGGGANNTVDSRPCVFFQIDSLSTWYAVSQSDGNYLQEAEFLLLHSADGAKIKFYQSGTVCGASRVGSLSRKGDGTREFKLR